MLWFATTLEGMMHIVSVIALTLCSLWLCCQPAFAEKRIALVIGNSSYERVPMLSNPANDANAMSEMFERACGLKRHRVAAVRVPSSDFQISLIEPAAADWLVETCRTGSNSV